MAEPESTPDERVSSGSEPALPAWKSFVVQFTRETGRESAICAGRAEHLASGQRASFASREELFEFIDLVLDDPGCPRR